VQDEMLKGLSGLKQLEYLNLYGTGITDSSLTYLGGLKNLTALYLWQTKVTEAGVAKLKTTNPALQISFGSQ
jgi:Leucine-rich repeat (LRR) protein